MPGIGRARLTGFVYVIQGSEPGEEIATWFRRQLAPLKD
jgi:hypothetical protein